MMKWDALYELLDRIAAMQGKAVLISTHELSQWPAEEVAALKKYMLIRKATPATSVVCTECEEACIRPVYSVPYPDGDSRLFLVCDIQDDVNQITVSASHLEQWQSTGNFFANLVAELLELRRPNTTQTSAERWEVGLLKGNKHSSHTVLDGNDSLNLKLAGHSIALADVLTLKGDNFTIDKRMLIRFVDNPVPGGSDVESAEQRRERIQNRAQELKAQKVKAFLKTVAEEEGVSISRIKQLIKEGESTTTNPQIHW